MTFPRPSDALIAKGALTALVLAALTAAAAWGAAAVHVLDDPMRTLNGLLPLHDMLLHAAGGLVVALTVLRHPGPAGLAAGLLLGVVVGGIVPMNDLHAVFKDLGLHGAMGVPDIPPFAPFMALALLGAGALAALAIPSRRGPARVLAVGLAAALLAGTALYHHVLVDRPLRDHRADRLLALRALAEMPDAGRFAAACAELGYACTTTSRAEAASGVHDAACGPFTGDISGAARSPRSAAGAPFSSGGNIFAEGTEIFQCHWRLDGDTLRILRDETHYAAYVLDIRGGGSALLTVATLLWIAAATGIALLHRRAARMDARKLLIPAAVAGGTLASFGLTALGDSLPGLAVQTGLALVLAMPPTILAALFPGRTGRAAGGLAVATALAIFLGALDGVDAGSLGELLFALGILLLPLAAVAMAAPAERPTKAAHALAAAVTACACLLFSVVLLGPAHEQEMERMRIAQAVIVETAPDTELEDGRLILLADERQRLAAASLLGGVVLIWMPMAFAVARSHRRRPKASAAALPGDRP